MTEGLGLGIDTEQAEIRLTEKTAKIKMNFLKLFKTHSPFWARSPHSSRYDFNDGYDMGYFLFKLVINNEPNF